MTTITTDAIPEGSYVFRIFEGDKNPNVTDIDTIGYFLNNGDGVCEIAAVHGRLTDDINILIGLKAIELGFITMRFSALRNAQVTRYATYLGHDAYFDYYEVDLLAIKEELGL